MQHQIGVQFLSLRVRQEAGQDVVFEEDDPEVVVDVVDDFLVVDLQQVVKFGLVFDEVLNVELQVFVLLEISQTREEILVVLVVD